MGNIPGGRAFQVVAGCCSVAHAESLRRLRENKLYKSRCGTWEEFCPKYLGLSKAFANRAIRALEEFGAAFFELAELIRITPEEFRAVAPFVKGKFFHAGRESIALLPENAGKLAAAVEKLRQRAPRPARKNPPSSPLSPVKLLERQCGELTTEFRRLASLTGSKAQNVDRVHLATVLRQTLGMLGRIELDLGVF
jgi:hypothetical protein